jgi:hypothetical protein
MWSGQDKVWLQYRKDIMAADVQAATFLSSYLRNMAINKTYSKYLEVVDLQRYKVIKQAPKVSVAVRERSQVPFVFVIGKN